MKKIEVNNYLVKDYTKFEDMKENKKILKLREIVEKKLKTKNKHKNHNEKD